jgi:hypothetical protein
MTRVINHNARDAAERDLIRCCCALTKSARARCGGAASLAVSPATWKSKATARSRDGGRAGKERERSPAIDRRWPLISVPQILEAKVKAKLEKKPDITWHRAIRLIVDPDAPEDEDLSDVDR